jgi:dihydrolipoamide dehydrogenase
VATSGHSVARKFPPSAVAGAKGVEVEMQPATDAGQGGSAKAQKATFDILLVATGRGPVTEGLGVEALGIKMDRGYIVVDSLFFGKLERAIRRRWGLIDNASR